MPRRHSARRRRSSAPVIRRFPFSQQLYFEHLENRRMLAVAGFDFGDAPDPYATTLADDGARHEAIGPMLGGSRDEEADGQPSTAADGDGADEDGVMFGSIRVGQLDASLTVNVQNAPAGAKLDAWIDFNADGSWGGPGEQIFDGAPVNNGDNALSFDVPSWAASGNTYARFRLSTAGDLGMGGGTADGEVEDYQITIIPPAAATGVFGGPNTISTDADRARSVYAADVDGDGDIDVLSASRRDNKIAWYENDGSGGFTAHTISTDADGAHRVFTTDVDGDGDIDVLSASARDGKIAWYENDGSENFTAHTIDATADQAYGVFAADVDGDGDIDVLSASTSSYELSGKIAWYENDGSGGFAAHTISSDAYGAWSVFAADVDGDGDIDVLSASEAAFGGGGKITWYENNGSGGFIAHTINTDGIGQVSVFAADVDGDGDMDVLSASFSHHTITWYENDGSQRFTGHTISTDAGYARSVFVADVDGDGDTDVLSASEEDDKIAWYENDGSGGFTPHTISTDARLARSVFAADVDGDGDLDVLSASNNDDKIAWYENLSPIIPELPADLTGNGFVDFEDLTVLLAAWNQNVSAVEGNLVDAAGTPVNFEDLTVLLAAWTGPGPAGAPVGRRLAAAREAVGGDSVGDFVGVGPSVAVGDASYRRRDEPPWQIASGGSATGVASYTERRAARRSRSASVIYGRLQAVAVDRAMAEEATASHRAIVGYYAKQKIDGSEVDAKFLAPAPRADCR